MPSVAMLRGPIRSDLRRHETLPDLFEATAAEHPSHIALRDGNAHMTYGELNQRADLVAHHLIERGVRPGDIVGLWLPRGMDLLVMQLGIAKAGAAWLPFDADVPVERIGVCLEDANAHGLVTVPDNLNMLDQLPFTSWSSDTLSAPADSPLHRRDGLMPHHPAYVIYTSGSTGKPKGIVIEQGSICHFVRSENAILGIHGDDLVYQGFSVAFDMSFEEIWISYLVGATLWIAPKAIVGDPDALPRALNESGVTVLHAVPTLLALFSQDVPSLRLINLGGEMCPDSLVERWATPERQLFNTYGPTEATVSASLAQLKRGEPVTIGTPLPNYGLLIVDDTQQILPIGETGELCITGPGVAQGYLGRPDLTAEKFLPNPYATSEDETRLYRTGDLARIDEAGNIQCLGRADDQIKIRGFRVELGEIEAVLSHQPGVGTAAVILRQADGMDQLVAYVVADGGNQLTIPALCEGLRAVLPPYMVPGRYEFLEVLPRLTSGKIDRKALRAMELSALPPSDESAEPQNDAERVLFDALGKLFPGQPLRLTSDFFCDLGGHSLLAARLVSALRNDTRFAHVNVQTVYQGRTIGAIANSLQQMIQHPVQQREAFTPSRNNSPLRRWRCGVFQAAAIPFLVCLGIGTWLAPFFTYHIFTGDNGDSIPFAMIMSLGVFLLTLLLNFAVAIIGRQLLISGLKAGRYPLWGITYYRWWLNDRLNDLAPVYLLHGSTLYNHFLRALGMKIDRDVTISSMSVRVPHLIRLGNGASIGAGVNLENAYVERGELVIGEITIGNEAYVGSYAIVEGNTLINDYARLESLSALTEGQQIPERTIWDGTPAQLSGTVDPAQRRPRLTISPLRSMGETVYYAAGAMLIAILFFMPIFPVFMLIDWIDGIWLTPSLAEDGRLLLALQYMVLALPAAGIMILLTALLSAAIRWLTLSRLQPGTSSVHSSTYYRKWLTNQIQESSLHILHGVYATVYAPWWYRLLGAKIGKGAEISTAMGVVPDMLTLGEDTFIADSVMLGDEEIDGGWMTLKPTIVHQRSFVGNGAYIPDGTELPSDVLIGVQSKAPANALIASGDTWMGSPAIKLPARESLSGFPEALTFRPSPSRRLCRALIEGIRIVLPLAIAIGAGYLIVYNSLPYAENNDWRGLLYSLSLSGLYYSIGSFLFIAALKWLCIGRYQPRMAPMWTLFVWTSEAITSLYESIAVPNLLNMLRGTPLLPWALRLMGVHIGHSVYLDTTDVTEFDCAHIGSHTEMNGWTGPQTHLFEDRVMKIDHSHIGSGVTVRGRSTILYDTTVGDGVRLGPLSLIMKGERIPANTDWRGSPALPWDHPINASPVPAPERAVAPSTTPI